MATFPAIRIEGGLLGPDVLEQLVSADLPGQKAADFGLEARRNLTDEIAAGAGLLITMGCGEACPVVPGLRRADWPLPDPKGQPVERVREIRDEIRGRVHELVTAEGWSRAGTR